METPESIIEHEPKYVSNAWMAYEPAELGNWVHLLVKRAGMRSPDAKEKAQKDLKDAENYLDMLKAHIDYAKEVVSRY